MLERLHFTNFKGWPEADLACQQNIPVANATDSDWLHHRALLEANGVAVHFVAGDDPTTWFAGPARR